MLEIDQQQYSFAYAQRLESSFHEQIRKTIDLEVRLSFLAEKIQEEKNKFEESQKNVEFQNEIMQQAANSIQELTIKNKDLEFKNENSSKKVTELEANIHRISEKSDSFERLSNQKDSKIKELERELERQGKELQTTFEELQKLSELLLPQKKIKKTINKNNTEIDPVVIEEGNF
jgi:predicted RNase H-like nuclease (RuvC/YqgF family)